MLLKMHGGRLGGIGLALVVAAGLWVALADTAHAQ